METLNFSFPARRYPKAIVNPEDFSLCGVVGSGNLEVLMQPGNQADTCEIQLCTSAQGFQDIWRAVLGAFAAEYPVGGMRFAINDLGATPAVVSLRLTQAFHDFEKGGQ